MEIKNISFHESSVIELNQLDKLIHIKLSDIYINENHPQTNIEINLYDIGILKINGKEEKNLKMEYPDGEVLTLNFDNNIMNLIVEWNDFKNRHSIIKSYQVPYKVINYKLS